jgi:hypothetical protein
MPELKCRAHIAGVDTALQRDILFHWKIKMEYDSVLIRQDTVRGIKNWAPAWKDDFGGGYVSINVWAKYRSDSFYTAILPCDSIKLLGKNPVNDTIKAYLRADYDDEDKARQAEVIGFKESTYLQFNIENEDDNPEGFPLINRRAPIGVGIMQITDPKPTREDYWNWKINIDHGKHELANKWNSSEFWFHGRVGEGWPVPTDSNLLYDTYCRYNGGRYFSNIKNDSSQYIYVRNLYWINACGDCNDNPEAEKDTLKVCHQSGCCYSDQAMSIH